MPADRTNTCSRFADITAQKQQIGQHLNRFNSGAVLGQAHSINSDYSIGLGINGRCCFDSGPTQSGTFFKLLPGISAGVVSEFFKTVDMLADKFVIEHRWKVGRACLIIQFYEDLAHTHQSGDVTASLELMILGTYFGRGAGQHLDGRLRIREALQPPFS